MAVSRYLTRRDAVCRAIQLSNWTYSALVPWLPMCEVAGLYGSSTTVRQPIHRRTKETRRVDGCDSWSRDVHAVVARRIVRRPAAHPIRRQGGRTVVRAAPQMEARDAPHLPIDRPLVF